TRIDLRDLVLRTMSELAPGFTLEMLLDARKGTPTAAAIRRAVVLRARAAGHRGAQIARFLEISDGAVSRIAARRFDPQPDLTGFPA
ncbi:MAG TPA: hypothetical protein VK864_18180, partial [Longimicrobiales bacterium]|nr:hypothetical protein [Longimicrobiales bacterium]